MNNRLNTSLEKGIIEHSDSPYSSPITPVKKGDSTIPLCYDFRKLIAKTVPKSFPKPKAESVFNNVNKADVFTLESRIIVLPSPPKLLIF